MTHSGRAWTVQDRYKNEVYLTWERWHQHILVRHPEMAEFFEEVRDTVRLGRRRQDPLSPHRYRYVRWFDNLPSEEVNCIVAIVLVKTAPNERFVVTAYLDNRVEKR